MARNKMPRRITIAALALAAISLTGGAKAEEAPVIDRPFIAMSSMLVGASLYDAWSTNRALADCHTCREANPVARWAVDGGAGTYAFALGTDALIIGGAYVLKKRGYRYRWLLIAGTALHAAAGTANLRFVK